MKLDKKNLMLYVITDRTWLGDLMLKDQVEESLKGGATIVQLREKNLPFDKFLSEAKVIKSLAEKYYVPLIINDNIEVLLESDASGLHIGQGDTNARDARRLIGNDKILGVSVKTVSQALRAEEDGADYIGVGAVFETHTKEDTAVVSIDTLKEITEAVNIPVVAIGGINRENALELKGSGVDGLCFISAVFSNSDIYKATKELYSLVREVVKDH